MTPEEETEMRLLRQEATIAKQAARIARLEKRISDLQGMVNWARKTITTLQAQLKRQLAEQVFSDD